MIVYRLSKKCHASNLSGKRVEISGNRWNSKATAMIYTSTSRALAVTEIAVHTPLGNLPEDYFIISLALPKHSFVAIIESDLAIGWNTFPHAHLTKNIDDQFITENKYLVMKLPSAIMQGDFNFLVNPKHKKFHQVKIIEMLPFEFDKRLFNK